MKKTPLTQFIFLTILSQAIFVFIPRASNGLTLEEAVTLALDNNPDLQKQQMNRALSEEGLSGKKSDNFGKFEKG